MLLYKKNRYHIYYHCSRQVNRDCKEPGITEEDLTQKLSEFIRKADPKMIKVNEQLKAKIMAFQNIRNRVLIKHNIQAEAELDLPSYLEYISKEGRREDVAEVIAAVKCELYVHEKLVTMSRN